MKRPLRAACLVPALLAAVAHGASAQAPDITPPPKDPLSQAELGTPPAKALPTEYGDAIGTWDLSLDGSNNRCVVTLSSENGANGRIVRFPAGCRRALPLLNAVAGWIFTDGGIRLIDRNIYPLLQFSARADKQSLVAKSEKGQSYSLVPLQTIGMLPPQPPPQSAAPPPAAAPVPDAAPDLRGKPPDSIPDVAGGRAIPGSQPVLSGTAITPRVEAQPVVPENAPVPGVYALDRFNEKDVCRLELEAKARPSDPDLAPARILPGCHDSGMTTFDPNAWRFANGHMTLKSKRGHAVNLVATGEGTWRRDPDVGTTLVLRRVQP